MKKIYIILALLLVLVPVFYKGIESVNGKNKNEEKIFNLNDNSELDIPKIEENENFKITSMKVKYASIPGEFKINITPMNSVVHKVISDFGKEKILSDDIKIVSKVEIDNDYFDNNEVEIKPDGIYDVTFKAHSKNGYKGKINIFPFNLNKYYGLGYGHKLPDLIVFDSTKIPFINKEHNVKFEKRKFTVQGEPIDENTVPQKEVEIIYPYYSVNVDFKKGDNYFDFEIIKDSQESVLGEKGFIYESNNN